MMALGWERVAKVGVNEKEGTECKKSRNDNIETIGSLKIVISKSLWASLVA